MHPLFDLTGRLALITGSSQGLGRSFAEALAEAGASVVLNDIDSQRVARAALEFREKGLNVVAVPFDVTAPEEIRRGIEEIGRVAGKIDILINNVGIQIRHPAVEFPFEDWDRLLRTNLSSVFYVARQVVESMIQRGCGKIINVCSVLSELARPNVSAYAASKGGVKMLTKSMAAEWGRFNIQCNGIGPGYFITEMNKALLEDADFDAWIRGRTPSGRWGEPSDLKGPVVFLASRASDYVNGHILYVDGGLLATI
jgi:gluconate 5-dehydrogenase